MQSATPSGIVKPSDLRNKGIGFPKPKPKPEPEAPSKPNAEPPLLPKSHEEPSHPTPTAKPGIGTKPSVGRKPPLVDKPAVGNKPQLPTKPTVAPKGSKIADRMKNFESKPEQKPEPFRLGPSKPLPLDRSPMTGRKIPERKSSVKDLTERYNSPSPEDVEVTLPTRKPLPPKEATPPPTANIFRRKELEDIPTTNNPLLPRKPPSPMSPEPRPSSTQRSLPPRNNSSQDDISTQEPLLPPRPGDISCNNSCVSFFFVVGTYSFICKGSIVYCRGFITELISL